MRTTTVLPLFTVVVGALLALAAPGCGSSTSSSGADMSAMTGSFVAGALDTHCSPDGGAVIKQPTSQEGCTFRPDGGEAGGDYGETQYNAEADDDDCKYHVKASASSIARGQDVTFTVAVTRTIDGAAATGAKAMAEVFLSDTHAGLVGESGNKESSPGTYALGPIKFDQPGRWTVRFHFYDSCLDFSEESPHGHVAFYVDVP